ncbi:MAG: TetR/AcrR family transcriptional regulator [Burkholderiales bacterium]|nr:MAG: TetR/AcrR family transcriptional regulator [Burkholderiales bacterium]
MARTRAPDYEQHRDRILVEAVQAFARIGYPSASMSRLARACGVSKATLYHYFSSKDALLFEALDRYTRSLGARLEAVRARRLAPRDELAAIVRTLMDQYRSSHAYHAALLNDVKFLAQHEREMIRAQERVVVDAVAHSIERAFPLTVTAANRTVVTMALLGMVNFTFAWLDPDGPVSHDQFAEAAIELWTRGLEAGRLGSLRSLSGPPPGRAPRAAPGDAPDAASGDAPDAAPGEAPGRLPGAASGAVRTTTETERKRDEQAVRIEG